MSNGGLKPKSRSTQRDSRKPINGAIDTWKATVDGESVWGSVRVWVCVWVCEGKRFTGTNPPDVECVASFRRPYLPGLRPRQEFVFSTCWRHKIHFFPAEVKTSSFSLTPLFTNFITIKSVFQGTCEALEIDTDSWKPLAADRTQRSNPHQQLQIEEQKVTEAAAYKESAEETKSHPEANVVNPDRQKPLIKSCWVSMTRGGAMTYVVLGDIK